MLKSPYTISDLIQYMDDKEVKKLFSSNQIEFIKDALKHRWTFKPDKEAA